MATRSRTLLFLQFRNSYSGTHAATLRQQYSHLRQQEQLPPYESNERVGLMDGAETAIEMMMLPPKWVDIVDEVDEELDRIKTNVQRLDTMHKKHLLPGFDDRIQEERDIERLTDEITQQFHGCQRRIKRINSESRQSDSNQEQIMSRNVQMSLAQKVQDASTLFRQKQNTYMQRMRGVEMRNKDIFSSGVQPMNSSISDESEEIGFTSAQLAFAEQSNASVTQREQEINHISRSIFQLADIFKDLQTMVIDQGTLLDRIDFNVEQAAVHLQDAVYELDEGEKYQKKARNRKIILLLILIIAGLFIILIFKPKHRSAPPPAPPSGVPAHVPPPPPLANQPVEAEAVSGIPSFGI
ncbi:syntaxin 16 [Entomortierella parvispora]|uniref:Syntaxin 16 n=1 Tax=Entomortierella parvispora TaxID=205924 RepID=A0A9P3HED4_9FUNG|nr:syntaxin 16 [Entomortierella parvispora]